MKLLATLLLAAAALMSAPAPAADRVYVIRHLEKQSGEDPALTAIGAARARQVAEILAGSGIKAVFATATRRAQQTAAPLATRLQLPVTTYRPADVEGLVELVAGAGGPVLIVGHSNTVPDLVAAFGGTKPEPLGENDYGTIYIVDPGKSAVQRIELECGAMPVTGSVR